jgi:hypothetical protein
MPRPTKTTPTSRLTLEMPEPVRKQLEHVRDQTHASSLTEVIQRALAVYDLLRKATAEGAKIVLENEGNERELAIPEFGLRDYDNAETKTAP